MKNEKVYATPSFLRALEELRDRKIKTIILMEKQKEIIKNEASTRDELIQAVEKILNYENQLRRLENNIIGIIELSYFDVKASLPSKVNDVGDMQGNSMITLNNDQNNQETISPKDLYLVDAVRTIFNVPEENITISSKI